MKNNNKNILKITLFALTTIFGTQAIASDATSIANTGGFIPSSDTKAARAEVSATNALNQAIAVKGIADEANGIAKGTRATLVNKEGCVYNSNFDCTEANLTHQYQSKIWNTPGTYYWTVPANISKIYVSLISGNPKAYGNGYWGVNEKCLSGGTVSVAAVSVTSGCQTTVVNLDMGDWVHRVYKKTPNNSSVGKYQFIAVSPGQRIKIVIQNSVQVYGYERYDGSACCIYPIISSNKGVSATIQY